MLTRSRLQLALQQPLQTLESQRLPNKARSGFASRNSEAGARAGDGRKAMMVGRSVVTAVMVTEGRTAEAGQYARRVVEMRRHEPHVERRTVACQRHWRVAVLRSQAPFLSAVSE